jgi:hypothetical protein
MEEPTGRKAPSADLARHCSSPVACAAAGLGKRGALMSASSSSCRRLEEEGSLRIWEAAPCFSAWTSSVRRHQEEEEGAE